MSVSKHIPPDIKKVARCIGYAAWLDTDDAWLGLPVVLALRLEVHQRAALAYAALRTMDEDQIGAIVEVVAPQQHGAGQPQAAFNGIMDQASFWADLASQDERDAYMLASFNRSPAPRRAAFLEYVQGRAAA